MKKLTDAEIDTALARGKAARLHEPRAAAARYDRVRKRVVVELTNACTFAFPPRLAQGLGKATEDQLAQVEVLGSGTGLHWETLDVDLSVPDLLAGLFGTKAYMARRAGQARSLAKAAAARANGAKGGRPRQVAHRDETLRGTLEQPRYSTDQVLGERAVPDLICEFDTVIDDVVGLYLDAKSAMMQFAKFLTQTQVTSAARLGVPVEKFDSLGFTYGSGDPNNPQSLDLHSTTQGNIKVRNAKGGRNHLLLGQHFIVDLYAFWEDEYRQRIADSLHREKDSIQSDVFGDIRYMRRSIIHHRGVAVPDIRKCKVLTWFSPGDIIDISDDAKFYSLITEVRKWLDAFGLEVSGSSPGLLSRYGPTGHRKI